MIYYDIYYILYCTYSSHISVTVCIMESEQKWKGNIVKLSKTTGQLQYDKNPYFLMYWNANSYLFLKFQLKSDLLLNLEDTLFHFLKIRIIWLSSHLQQHMAAHLEDSLRSLTLPSVKGTLLYKATLWQEGHFSWLSTLVSGDEVRRHRGGHQD